MEEKELETRMRAGLERRATGTDVGAPVVERVRAEVGARRRTRRAVGAAAAAVVVVVGGIGVVTQQGEGGGADAPPVADETPPSRTAGEGGLRTEYWGAVSVEVPADWGYGGAPFSSGGGSERVACWPAAMVLPDGSRPRRGEDPQLGYVGRPVALTDVCAGYPWIEHSPQQEPTAPYVWLGAAVEPGVVEYDNGYVQETVVLAGSTITVGTDNPGLRARILASARDLESVLSPRSNTLCPVMLATVTPGRTGLTREGRGELLEAAVCAYRRNDSGDFALSYAAALDPSEAAAGFRAAEEAPRADAACGYRPEEFVVLRGWYEDPFGGPGAMTERLAVYEMGCGGSVDTGAGTHQLSAAAVEPWARNGIPAVVHGPTGGKGAMLDAFIGPQG